MPAVVFNLPPRTKMIFANGGTSARDRQRAIILVNPQIPNGVQKAILGDGPDDPTVVIEAINAERTVTLSPEHSTDGQAANYFGSSKYRIILMIPNSPYSNHWEVQCEDGTDDDYNDFIITVLMQKMG